MTEMQDAMSHERATALWVAAFFDELVRWGVHDVVISPGSRSTALAMAAFELAERRPNDLRVFVDVDERGAAFFGLGLAKASGAPTALVCTSGTALANYYPAVMEADVSRVPLIVLSGDRPARMQGLGAPQTVDQAKAYGERVRAFRAMPLPSSSARDAAFVRQAARELCLAARGAACEPAQNAREFSSCSRGCTRYAGPVHANFPFEEPLKPDFTGFDAFSCARRPSTIAPIASASAALSDEAVFELSRRMAAGRTIVLAGEGTCETLEEAREMAAWAERCALVLAADPLSGLRSVPSEAVMDNCDNVARAHDIPDADVVIRFGRYPISKHTTAWAQRICAAGALQIVVDVRETRDFGCATDAFVPVRPIDFVRACAECAPSLGQRAFFEAWRRLDDSFRDAIERVEQAPDADRFEGAYVHAALRLAPERSCVFTANSMAVRALDTFYEKSSKPLCVLCNRGLNGIDGTVSTALGAAQHFRQTTFITGDFTLLHDMAALALQREIVRHHGGAQAPSIVVVLLNNNGGAIFDMLPQASDEPSFDRLFLAPQDVDFEAAARAFGVPYRRAGSVGEFERAYKVCLGVPGISVVEVRTPLRNVKERYAPYQR